MAAARTGAMGRSHSQFRFHPRRREAALRTPASISACWYRRRIMAPRLRGRTAPVPQVRRGRLPGKGVGQRHLCRRSSRRLHAVLLRYHATDHRSGRVARSSCAPRTIRTICKAARQAGLAARAALDLVSANDRHLADGLARSACRRPRSSRIAFTPHLARWEIGVERVDGRRSRASALRLSRHAHAAAARCSPTTPTRSSPARCTAASRCRIRASTTPATSCCGARTHRT